MYSRLDIVGNLGQDAVIKATKNGKPVAIFRIPMRDCFKKEQDPPTWVAVFLFGPAVEKIAPYLVKGRLVLVSGGISLGESEHQGEKILQLMVKADTVKLLGGQNFHKIETREQKEEEQTETEKTEIEDEAF